MAVGTPVLVSLNGALPEVVGDAGVVAEASTAEALARSLSDLLTDRSRRGQLERAGKERASAFFSYAKQADTILEIMEEVASVAQRYP